MIKCGYKEISKFFLIYSSYSKFYNKYLKNILYINTCISLFALFNYVYVKYN